MKFFRRLSNSAAVWCVVAFTTGLSIIAISRGLNNPIVKLNENQILYLFSTSAQVLSAIYGLTLTAFVFYMESLNREASTDETLVQTIDVLRDRYYWHLIFISFLVIASLFLSNAIISYESSKDDYTSIILINGGQTVYAVTLISIVIFICDVIYPNSVEQASKSIQADIDKSLKDDSEQGSLERFVQNYNEIEALIQKVSSKYFDYRKSRRLRISNMRLAELLFKNDQISELLFGQLSNLIRLRNAIIHGAEPRVSQNMVAESEIIKDRLKKELNFSEAEPPNLDSTK